MSEIGHLFTTKLYQLRTVAWLLTFLRPVYVLEYSLAIAQPKQQPDFFLHHQLPSRYISAFNAAMGLLAPRAMVALNNPVPSGLGGSFNEQSVEIWEQGQFYMPNPFKRVALEKKLCCIE